MRGQSECRPRVGSGEMYTAPSCLLPMMLSTLHQANRGAARLLSTCRISHVFFPNVKRVSQFSSATSVDVKGNDTTMTAARFTRLNECFKRPATVNSDDVMEDMRALINADIKVPLSYYMDSARLFTTRRDILRTELLLHMSKKNLGTIDAVDAAAGETARYSASRLAQDPFHRLVSFSVSLLISRGATEEAMRLWVRMSSAGFLTNSYTLQEIMRRLAYGGNIHNLDLFHKIHSMVVARAWQHLPGYVESYLAVMRNHLKWACTSLGDVRADIKRVDHEWEQVASAVVRDGGALARITILHALRVQCLIAAETACRRISGTEAQKAAEEYADLALKSFMHLLESRAAHDREGGHPDVVHEITRLFATESNKLDAKALSSMHSDMNLNSHESTELDRTPAVPQREAPSQDNRSSQTGETAQRISAESASVAVRAVVNELVLSLCKRGLTDAVVQLLQNYLQHLHLPTTTSTPSTNARFRSPTASTTRQQQRNHKIIKSDPGFARYLMEECMQHIRFPTLEGPDAERRQARYNRTAEFVQKLATLASNNDMPLRSHFVARRIMHAAQCLEPADWKAFEQHANTLIDAASDEVGRSPHVHSFLINALAVTYKDPEAVKRAHARVKEFLATEGKVLPSAWVALLNGAAQTLEDKDLSDLLQSAEEGILSVKATAENASVLTARLYAHARLGHGYQALSLLSKLRNMHSAGEATPSRWLYTHVINALYHAWPGKDEEWRLAKSPTGPIEYLLRELSRDGVAASQGTVAALLKLYTKQAQITVAQNPENLPAVMKDAQKFLTNMAKTGGYIGHAKVPVSNDAIRELVKMSTIAGDERKALEVLQTSEKLYGIKPEASAWEPLVYYYAVVRGALQAAEDTITLMTNAGLKPTEACIDSIVRGFLLTRDPQEALERLEELHNLTGVRPAPATLLELLESALHSKDKYEAQSVASMILRMFTEEERARQVVGIATTARQLGQEYAEKERRMLIDRLEAAKSTSDKATEPPAVSDSVSSQYIARSGMKEMTALAQQVQEDNEALQNSKKTTKRATTRVRDYGQAFSNTKLQTSGHYRLHEGQGGGRVLHAPLSRAAIERMFADAGIEMPKY